MGFGWSCSFASNLISPMEIFSSRPIPMVGNVNRKINKSHYINMTNNIDAVFGTKTTNMIAETLINEIDTSRTI